LGFHLKTLLLEVLYPLLAAAAGGTLVNGEIQAAGSRLVIHVLVLAMIARRVEVALKASTMDSNKVFRWMMFIITLKK